MDVDVDANARLLVSQRQDEVGGLPSHTGQREQLFQRIGNLSPEAADQMLANLTDSQRLRPVETHRIDQPPGFLQRQVEHLLGGTCSLEEAPAGRLGHLILGAQRQQAGD